MYEKSDALLISMCMRADHSFGLSCPDMFKHELFNEHPLRLKEMQSDLINSFQEHPQKVLLNIQSVNLISHIILFKEMHKVYEILSDYPEKLKNYTDIQNQHHIKLNLSQIHEEMIGEGFFSPDIRLYEEMSSKKKVTI